MNDTSIDKKLIARLEKGEATVADCYEAAALVRALEMKVAALEKKVSDMERESEALTAAGTDTNKSAKPVRLGNQSQKTSHTIFNVRGRWKETAAKEFYARFVDKPQQTVPISDGLLIVHADGLRAHSRCDLWLSYVDPESDWGLNFAVGKDGEICTYGAKTNLDIPKVLSDALNGIS
ncbi:MAG: hypothetical protein JRN21_10110 [Nitrososphaerota archaeon]|nr:hypothetical protein [Nitrososphaerota archaeon]